MHRFKRSGTKTDTALRGLVRVLAAALLSLMLILPLQAESLRLDGTAIELTVPAGWKTLHAGQRQITLKSNDGTLDVVLLLLEPERSKGMMDRLMNVLRSKVGDVRANPAMPGPVKFKDYEATFLAGTGKLAGQPVEWEYALLEMEKTVVVMSIARSGISKRAKSDFNALLQSLKPKAPGS